MLYEHGVEMSPQDPMYVCDDPFNEEGVVTPPSPASKIMHSSVVYPGHITEQSMENNQTQEQSNPFKGRKDSKKAEFILPVNRNELFSI